MNNHEHVQIVPGVMKFAMTTRQKENLKRFLQATGLEVGGEERVKGQRYKSTVQSSPPQHVSKTLLETTTESRRKPTIAFKNHGNNPILVIIELY
mmetsp:Transcript_141463/g.246373  ORF Transcript_141463/g.246373 Transcript_141463/m.246373 type:complete len:95 (-) Transcript_141463:1001-1285(-)